MDVEQAIEAIRSGIRAGSFANEASVSQGIVLRLLRALGWPSYDTDAVWPEYSLGGRRVDFALCSPPRRPIAFIEVKQLGQSDGAERQLFEYAFHVGVPLAILTDGREWNFFLPAEQGDYGERRVYKLDIVDRDVKECSERLERYLLYSAVVSGAALQAARDDYRDVYKGRQMLATLPMAWQQIIADEDEFLLEIVADRVEQLCGFKPSPDMVANFLKESATDRVAPLASPARPKLAQHAPYIRAQRARHLSTTREALEASRREAIEAGWGPVEQTILEAITAGRVGFRGGWISSTYIGALLDSRQLRGRAHFNQWDAIMKTLGYIKHPVLRLGRVDNPVSPDGKRPILWVRQGSILEVNLRSAAEVAKAYTRAQETSEIMGSV